VIDRKSLEHHKITKMLAGAVILLTLFTTGCTISSAPEEPTKDVLSSTLTSEETIQDDRNGSFSVLQRLRITNQSAITLHDLVVVFPDERIEFGDVPAGATTNYQDVPHGVYRYAAYDVEVAGQEYEQTVVDWIGEATMHGEFFTYTIEVDPSRWQTEGQVIQLIKASEDPEPDTTHPSTPTFTAIPSTDIVSGEALGKLYETVLSIPAGKTGMPYRGVGIPDMEITGPNAIAVLSDGSLVIADLIDNRLWVFSTTGQLQKTFDLYSLDILNVADLQAYNNELYVLEIYLDPPVHYRINRLSLVGDLIAYYDIPEGYYIENGLTGFMIDCAGNIFLDLAGRLHPFPIADVTLASSSSESNYECNNKTYYMHDTERGEKPKLTAGSITLETSLTYGFGSLSLLKVLPDGSFFVVREDMINDQVIQVDTTVHYISANGEQLGIARVPVDERYYYIMRNLAVGPDGNVYCLLPTSDSLKILRLNFYKSLDPLLPRVEVPNITISTTDK
jgi:hypothetical protein